MRRAGSHGGEDQVVRRAPRRPEPGRALLWRVGAGAVSVACLLAVGWAFGALAWAAPAAALVGALWYLSYRSRRAEVGRLQGLQAELSIYRVGETMASARSDSELVDRALDAIADETGFRHWAFYARGRGAAGTLTVLTTRGLPADARATLTPDPIGAGARSAASRAAWIGDTQVLQGAAAGAGSAAGAGAGSAAGAGAAPELDVAARIEGLGARPTIVSIPLPDPGDAGGVLQCFLPEGVELESDRMALLRWMTAQVSNGLKRLRLERRDQLLASYMMSTGEILFGLDASGEITHANRAAELALGAAPEGLVGAHLDSLASPEGHPEGTSILELVRTAGEFSGEIWFLRQDGTRFPAEVRLSPTLGGDGGPSAMVLVGHDDSERRGHERELESRSLELAQVNERLQAANKALEKAQRHQETFLANTSHELRTPLNAVIGFATLLEQGAATGTEETQEFANSIRESAEHLLTVINDLLDLAKVQAGRFQLRLEPGDVRVAIKAAAEAVGPAAARKGLRLRLDLPEEPLAAALDPGRLKQVMLNLLGNAVKFTDKGEVRVRAWRDPETEEARIVIEDTGIGIAKDRQARLFTKFGQADTSYHRRHGGTGLGLAISRALVGNMGGTISVESDGANRGTRASLSFPPWVGAAVATRGI